MKLTAKYGTFAAFLLIATTTVHAQQDDTSKPVIVVGRRAPQAKAIQHLVGRITAMTDGQVARFGTSLCFSVDGFVSSHDDVFRRRLEDDARLAKLDVRAAGCKPNVMVMLVDNGRAMLNTLYSQNPGLFLSMTPSARRLLLSEEGPVHVMTTTEIRSSDGRPPTAAPPPGVPRIGYGPYLPVQSASIINASSRQDILSSMILIDKSATLGKTVRQIADYAAMRTLSRLRGADVVTSEPTILALFAHDAPTPPMGLTTFDRAYLTGVYAGEANREGNSKVASIARTIAAATARASSGETSPAVPLPHSPGNR